MKVKNKKKTPKEIAEQIKGLLAMKGKLPQYSKFSGDNWGKIDAQIAVLEGKRMPDDYYQDNTSEDFEDGDNELWSEADRARRWMAGEEREDLFE